MEETMEKLRKTKRRIGLQLVCVIIFAVWYIGLWLFIIYTG